MKNINKRRLYVILVPTLLPFIVIAIIYLVAGVMAVPTESPLSDENYVLPYLNDLGGQSEAINQLNGGEHNIGPNLIFYVIVVVVVIASILAFVREDNGMPLAMIYMTAYTTFLKALGADVMHICFVYTYLRAGAQPIIDSNHNLRVIFAYTQLICEEHRKHDASWPLQAIMVTTFLCALLIMLIVEHFTSSKKKVSTTEDRPV